MTKSMRLLLCASTAALILGVAPIGAFVAPAQAQVEVSITTDVAPPLLPVYAQPPIPGPGYIWIPGYWAWNDSGYYWAPGYWALPPAADLYWTPPYWAWNDGSYTFYAGYWGPTVGYYGGVDYGFGYTGQGYEGGLWRNNQFVYNTAVNNLAGAAIAATFMRAVSNPGNRVAFNGGQGGTTVRPTHAQIVARAHATPPTAEQARHQETASRDPALHFNANHGKPKVAAMQRANEFHGAHAAAATNAPAERSQAATHLPPARPQTAEHALTAQPKAAEHASAAAQPKAAEHAAAMHAAARPHVAPHPPAMHAARHAPAMHMQAARHTPAMHAARHAPAMHMQAARHTPAMHAARHAPAMHMQAARHAPAMHAPARQHFAYHAPAMRMGGAPHMGGMRMAAPHMAAPHMGAPHMGAMRVGGAPHAGARPHGGGGGPRHAP